MSDLTIRPYRPADRDALIGLWERCGLTVWYNDPARDIALWQASPNAEIFVGELDGRIVAGICIGHDGHRGNPYYVAVDPDFRSRGYGEAMMRHAEAWLTRLGVPKMNVMIRETNTKVRAFYAAIGYEETPRLVMARWLTPDGKPPQGPVEAVSSSFIRKMEFRRGPSKRFPTGSKYGWGCRRCIPAREPRSGTICRPTS